MTEAVAPSADAGNGNQSMFDVAAQAAAAAGGDQQQNAAPQGQEKTQPQAPAKPSWRDDLPDDLKGNEALSKFDSADPKETLAKITRSYVNLEKMMGGDKLPKPKGADDKDALDQVYAALGKPASADEYKITRPTELPEGLSIDEEGEAFLKQFAHENNWNQQQLDNAYKAFYEREGKQLAERGRLQKTSYDDCQRALQATGNAPEIMNQAGAMIRNYGDPQVIAKFKAAGLDNDPVVVQFLARAGADLIGHSVLKGRGGTDMASAATLSEQITKYRTDNQAALFDAAHPNHVAATQGLSDLYRRKHEAQAGSQ